MSQLLPALEPAVLAPRPRERTVRIALAGCGVVGGSLLRLLDAEGDALAGRYGLRFDVTRVLVRDAERPRGSLPRERVTADVAAFLAADADVVVELVGGIHTPLRIAEAALRAGRAFVTANKSLVAAHGPALAALAERHGGRFEFESAVGGGMPVVRALRDSLAPSGIRRLRGVLNGTTSYLLARLGEGAGYAAALAEAQALGFAEADPTRDVDGTDAAEKLAIAAWLGLGVDPRRLAVRRRGLLPHPERIAADARAHGGVACLLAECVALGGGVAAAVEPAVVAADSELGRVRAEENVLVVDTRWAGTVRVAGPGAGGEPTAAMLLGDLIHGARPLGGAPSAVAVGVPDARPLRWALSVVDGPGAAERLRAEAGGGGAEEPVSDPGQGVRRVVTAPLPWARVAAVERALAAAGLEPVVLRYER